MRSVFLYILLRAGVVFMKRIVIFSVMLALLVSLCGCDEDIDYTYEYWEENENHTALTGGYDSSDTWAFYWYLCGSDLESDAGLASDDLEEMLEVELSDNVTVVIETGGAFEWYSDVSSDHNSRFLYNSEGYFLLDELPIANMGSPDTLADFLNFCNENYPADHQAVIFWNHGGGSVSGAAFDEIYDYDSLTLPEMREAFEAAPAASGSYEIIGFDTCLMATIDVVDTFSGIGNYLVASEELEPGGGWDYEAVFGAISDNPGMNGAQLGKEICNSYYQICRDNGTDDMITLSVVDLSQSEELVEAYNDIGTEALSNAGVSPSYLGAFGRAARSAENYGGNNDSEGYTNMVDLGDLVRQAGDDLLPGTGEALLSALESAVVYQVKSPLRRNASGLSCYYSYDGDYDSYTRYSNLSTSPAFQYYFEYMLSGEASEELVEYMSTVSEAEVENIHQEIVMPTADDLEDYPVEITDDGIAVLTLGSDIADSLTGVYINLAYIDDEGEIAIFLGSDNDLEADWENGIFEDNFRGVWGSLDGELVYMELSDEAEDYQVYAVPVLLSGEEYTMLVSYLYDAEDFRILGLRKGIDENGMADGKIRPLIPGDIIEPLHYVVDLETEEVTQIAVDSVVVSEDTSFYEIDMGDGEFLFMFEMCDIQNNSYLSEAITITVEDGEIFLESID